MSNEIKLHLGCGSVYLNDYFNIDAFGFSPKSRPDLLKQNSTDIWQYYKYPYKVVPFGQNSEKGIILDIKADVCNLPFADNSVDEILTVNLINHLRFQDFIPQTINDWHRVLKPNGKLIIDVDDVVGMSKKVVDAKTDEELAKALRYLYCHSRNMYDSHKWGYTDLYLKTLIEPVGFTFQWRNDEYIYHDADYPRFLVCFAKN